MDFAVWHEGLEEGTGRWVIQVQGDRVLLTEDDGTFYWRDLSDCKLVRVATPEMAQPVVVIQPQPQAPAILPAGMMPNRMMRRNGHN